MHANIWVKYLATVKQSSFFVFSKFQLSGLPVWVGQTQIKDQTWAIKINLWASAIKNYGLSFTTNQYSLCFAFLDQNKTCYKPVSVLWYKTEFSSWNFGNNRVLVRSAENCQKCLTSKTLKIWLHLPFMVFSNFKNKIYQKLKLHIQFSSIKYTLIKSTKYLHNAKLFTN